MTKAEIELLIDEITPNANYTGTQMNALLREILNFAASQGTGGSSGGGDIVTGNIVSGESPNKEVNIERNFANWNSPTSYTLFGTADYILDIEGSYIQIDNLVLITGKFRLATTELGTAIIRILKPRQKDFIYLDNRVIGNVIIKHADANEWGDVRDLSNQFIEISITTTESQNFNVQFNASYYLIG